MCTIRLLIETMIFVKARQMEQRVCDVAQSETERKGNPVQEA